MKQKKVLLISTLTLFFLLIIIGCSQKSARDEKGTNEQNGSKPSSPALEKNAILTLEEYLTLPVWETERAAFGYLSMAASSGGQEEMIRTCTKALDSFKSMKSTLETLKIADSASTLNTMQMEICRIYIGSLEKFIQSKDPADLTNLNSADNKMDQFIKYLKNSGVSDFVFSVTLAPFLKDLVTNKALQKRVTSMSIPLTKSAVKAFFGSGALDVKGNTQGFFTKVVDQAEEAGALDEVREILEKKVKEGKATPSILFTLAMVYERKGLKKEAFATLEKVEKEVKKHPAIAFNLSLVYGRKKQLKTDLKTNTILYHTPPGFILVKGWGISKTTDTVIKDFFIKKNEVTFTDFDAYCDSKGISRPSDNGWGRGKNPVINVSWYDAAAYCNWLSTQKQLDPCYSMDGDVVTFHPGKDGFRLPTQAEWEYAAKGGDRSSGFLYSGSNTMEESGWFAGNSKGRPHSVKTLNPNAIGIYDMSGNVWEWCQDWYSAARKYKVLKGGSWSYYKSDCTVSSTGRLYPSDKNTNTGFRIVQNVR